MGPIVQPCKLPELSRVFFPVGLLVPQNPLSLVWQRSPPHMGPGDFYAGNSDDGHEVGKTMSLNPPLQPMGDMGVR